jgi:hypothetical protein
MSEVVPPINIAHEEVTESVDSEAGEQG